MKCEIIFVSCTPVGLHVYGVSDERVCVGGELGFYMCELGGYGKVEELWEALGWGEGEEGEHYGAEVSLGAP